MSQLTEDPSFFHEDSTTYSLLQYVRQYFTDLMHAYVNPPSRAVAITGETIRKQECDIVTIVLKKQKQAQTRMEKAHHAWLHVSLVPTIIL
ncbi:hypothetical protein VNO77_03421 [Canavalia gladiata]|uniref:Uncharacterized protein n=1 Tax=Canavalia gladiata TaxID=3824 RepID=A0AAN9R6U0_CANGL